MKQPIRTEYKREHYYFNRTDPHPDIPFDEEANYLERKWWYWLPMVIGAMVVLSYMLGFIDAS